MSNHVIAKYLEKWQGGRFWILLLRNGWYGRLCQIMLLHNILRNGREKDFEFCCWEMAGTGILQILLWQNILRTGMEEYLESFTWGMFMEGYLESCTESTRRTDTEVQFKSVLVRYSYFVATYQLPGQRWHDSARDALPPLLHWRPCKHNLPCSHT
jgi:hypothetical protein